MQISQQKRFPILQYGQLPPLQNSQPYSPQAYLGENTIVYIIYCQELTMVVVAAAAAMRGRGSPAAVWWGAAVVPRAAPACRRSPT